MNREERSIKLKSSISNAARDLFIAQGYKMTTVRQIIKRAEIQTGTLYHFFKDKEDILLQIVTDTYEEAMKIADGLVGQRADPVKKYATICALELKAVEKYIQIAELYYESYSSWRITKVMTDYNVQRNRFFFSQYTPEFSEMDYYLKTLAIRGMRFNFITERIFSGSLAFTVKLPFLLKTELESFNVPDEKIEKIVRCTIRSVKNDRVNIRGFIL